MLLSSSSGSRELQQASIDRAVAKASPAWCHRRGKCSVSAPSITIGIDGVALAASWRSSDGLGSEYFMTPWPYLVRARPGSPNVRVVPVVAEVELQR